MPAAGSIRQDFAQHRLALTTLVVINTALAAVGAALAILMSVAALGEQEGDAGGQGGDDVKDLMSTVGLGSLGLGLLGIAGALRFNNLLFLYFVTLGFLIVLCVWSTAMVFSHQSEIQEEVRVKAAKDWPRYFGMMPQTVQISANTSQAENGGCFAQYTDPCWESVRGQFGGEYYAAAGALALALVVLMVGAMCCAKKVIGMESIVTKTELLLAHFGLLSGWLLLGLGFKSSDEMGTDIVRGYLSGVILVTGAALIGLSLWSYCNIYLPKAVGHGYKGRVATQGLRTVYFVLLFVIALVLLALSRECFFEKDAILAKAKERFTDEDLADMLTDYQKLQCSNGTASVATTVPEGTVGAIDADMPHSDAGCCQIGDTTEPLDERVCYAAYGQLCDAQDAPAPGVGSVDNCGCATGTGWSHAPAMPAASNRSGLSAIFNCEATSFSWKDLEANFEIQNKLDSWGWLLLLLFFFVSVRLCCIAYLVRHHSSAKPFCIVRLQSMTRCCCCCCCWCV